MTNKPKLIRYFYDSEFVDGPAPFAVEFFSIGIVPEQDNDPEYYGVSKEFNEAAAIAHVPWLKDNVIAKLPPMAERKSSQEIHDDIIGYLRKNPAQEVEFWAKNGAYDHFIFCKIFGTLNKMRDELKSIGVDRVVFRDIDELRRAAGDPQLPQEPAAQAHGADFDARWDRFLFQHLTGIIRQVNPAGIKALGL